MQLSYIHLQIAFFSWHPVMGPILIRNDLYVLRSESSINHSGSALPIMEPYLGRPDPKGLPAFSQCTEFLSLRGFKVMSSASVAEFIDPLLELKPA
jgi:hypothetical protein